jgi:hypothetical protein
MTGKAKPVGPSAEEHIHSGPLPRSQTPAQSDSMRASRITRAPALRGDLDGHYAVQGPQHGTSEIPAAISTPPRPRPSIPPELQRQVDAGFDAAEKLLQRGNPRGAVMVAQQAMKIAPPRPAQQAFYAWLLYERSGKGLPVPEAVFRNLDLALSRDETCVDGHCFKGLLLTRCGEVVQARKHLLRALELEPDNGAALRALRTLEGR